MFDALANVESERRRLAIVSLSPTLAAESSASISLIWRSYHEDMPTAYDQISELQGAIRAVSGRAESLVACFGTDRLSLRPRPESWSAAECLTHLKITMDAYFPLWANVLRPSRAASADADRPYRLDLWGGFLIWTLEPPPKFRFRTPPPFEPVETGPAEQVLPIFLESQQTWLNVLRDAAGLPLDRIKIVSPFNKHLRYSVWSSFCVNAAHHRRHLWQAERAVAAMVK